MALRRICVSVPRDLEKGLARYISGVEAASGVRVSESGAVMGLVRLALRSKPKTTAAK